MNSNFHAKYKSSMMLRPLKNETKMAKSETMRETAESEEGSTDPKIKTSLSLDKAKTEII